MSPPDAVCSPRLPASQAFLKMLRWLENYPRDDDGVYYATYGNGTFTDASKHPHKPHKKWGRTSTAAGAYMLIFDTWDGARVRGIVFDFMPTSQDKVAWWLIGQSHAQALVCAGSDKLEQAFIALGSQWASLPGASQSQVSIAQAKARYALYLGQYSAGAKQASK